MESSIVGNENKEQLVAWRKQKRAELLELRISCSKDQHTRESELILDRVDSLLRFHGSQIVGFYWPFKGEIDVLPLILRFVAQGGTAALPMVVGRARPLEFRMWKPGCRMTNGVFGIPYPAESDEVTPDTLVVPLLGYDARCYRLGYGGGYYDRTLEVTEPKPLTIGIGFTFSKLETIRPQQYDVPMDYIVTEAETVQR